MTEIIRPLSHQPLRHKHYEGPGSCTWCADGTCEREGEMTYPDGSMSADQVIELRLQFEELEKTIDLLRADIVIAYAALILNRERAEDRTKDEKKAIKYLGRALNRFE